MMYAGFIMGWLVGFTSALLLINIMLNTNDYRELGDWEKW